MEVRIYNNNSFPFTPKTTQREKENKKKNLNNNTIKSFPAHPKPPLPLVFHHFPLWKNPTLLLFLFPSKTETHYEKTTQRSSILRALSTTMSSSSSSNLFHMLLLVLVFSLLLDTHLQALTLPSDVSALVAFKSSIKPTTITPWSCLASWNFSYDPCSLPRRTHFICGITCNPDSTRVTSLVLDPVGYSGTLTPSLSKLTLLTHLDLSENSFYGPIPSSISSLINLETLTLRFNSFSGSLPPTLGSLKSLQSLDISHNALTGALPNSMVGLSSLRRIDLSFNKLTGSLPKLPPNLADLAMKANSLSGSLSESSYNGLNQLEVVELSSNMFTGTLKGWFFLLPSLQQVDLANNRFTGLEVLKPTNPRTDLVAVDLGYNQIDGLLPVNFGSFPLLSSLTLRYNKFTGPIPWQYGNKLSLRRLFLDGNYLNGEVPARFLSTAGSNSQPILGSFGDNCLESCPVSLKLCMPSQKPSSVCRKMYSKKP